MRSVSGLRRGDAARQGWLPVARGRRIAWRFAAVSREDDSAGVWERWHPVWHAFFYAVLGGALAVALASRALDRSHSILALGLGGTFALWYWVTLIKHPEWQHRPKPLALYFAGAIAFFLALVTLDGVFFFLTSCLYLQLFAFLPLRWAIIGASLLTVGLAGFQVAASGQPIQDNVITIAVFVIPALLGMGLAYYIHSIIGESVQRRQLIVELEATRLELAQRERLAGTLEERQRLAREIHDTLAQSLISIIMHLETAAADVPAPSPGRDSLLRATAITRASLDEARRSVHGLRPDALEGASLTDALHRLAASTAEDGAIVASATITGTIRPLGAETEVALLRVAQEATANVRRHAGPCRMALTLSYVQDAVILDVRDNGVGMDGKAGVMNPAARGGYGLASMRERIEALHGSFSIESAPGEGTIVTAILDVLATPS